MTEERLAFFEQFTDKDSVYREVLAEVRALQADVAAHREQAEKSVALRRAHSKTHEAQMAEAERMCKEAYATAREAERERDEALGRLEQVSDSDARNAEALGALLPVARAAVLVANTCAAHGLGALMDLVDALPTGLRARLAEPPCSPT